MIGLDMWIRSFKKFKNCDHNANKIKINNFGGHSLSNKFIIIKEKLLKIDFKIFRKFKRKSKNVCLL